jgi:hypothetical protein
MSTPMPDQYAPGEAFPDPPAADSPTSWAGPAQDYAGRSDGTAPSADVDPPAAIPPPVAGAEGPHTRPAWLTAGRPDDAA